MRVHGAAIMPTTLRPQSRPGAAPALTAGSTDAKAPGQQGGQQVGQSSGGITFRGTQAPAVSANTVMQHWGTSDAEGDINADGIVDAQDLAIALNGPSDPQGTVLQNWGQGGDSGAANSGDYNGDGTVDAMDLAMALNGGNSPRSLEAPAQPDAPTPEAIVANIVDATFAARDNDGDDQLVSTDFSDNGKLFKQLDLDHGGTIGRGELTKALFTELDRFKEQFPSAKPAAFARRWMDALTTGRNAPNMAQFQRVQQLFSPNAASKQSPRLLSVRA